VTTMRTSQTFTSELGIREAATGSELRDGSAGVAKLALDGNPGHTVAFAIGSGERAYSSVRTKEPA
jgi:hypothetical protein